MVTRRGAGSPWRDRGFGARRERAQSMIQGQSPLRRCRGREDNDAVLSFALGLVEHAIGGIDQRLAPDCGSSMLGPPDWERRDDFNTRDDSC